MRLTAKERKIAIEVLVSITFEAGIECLIAEVTDDGALLQESSEIIFSDEDMEVGYPDHRRPFYLAASINQIPTGASVNLIPLNTLQAAGISERKIQGCPMEVTGFEGRGEYTTGHIKGGPHSFLSLVPRGKDGGFISYAFGKAMIAQTPINPIHLSLVYEGKVEWQNDTHSSKSLAI